MATRAPTEGTSYPRRNPHAYAPPPTTQPPSRAPARRHVHSRSNSSNAGPPQTSRFHAPSTFAPRPPSAYADPMTRANTLQSHRPPGSRSTTATTARAGAGSSALSAGGGKDRGIEIEDEEAGSEEDDILVRDESGGFGVDGLAGTGGFVDGSEEEMDVDVENDEARRKTNSRLIQNWRSHTRQQIDPRELRAVVNASLLDKVASLHEDRWMYEPDLEPESRT